MQFLPVNLGYLQPMRFVLVGLLCSMQWAFAQSVQWADHVIAFSSAYDTKAYSAAQVLGPPSKLPATGRSTTAWSPLYPDKGIESITVGFATPAPVAAIYIGETLNPGAVASITLLDTRGKTHLVYSGNPKPIPSAGRLWQIKLPLTSFTVAQLTITLNTKIVPGYNQIDCIGISADTNTYIPKIPLAAVGFIAEKQNLGSAINTRYGEVHPIISPDNKTLFFTRKNHPDNVGFQNRDDIWYSTRLPNGQWSTAENIGSPLNNSGHNYLNAITTDGTTAFIGGTYGETTDGKDRLYLSRRTIDGWQPPQEVVIADFYNLSSYNSFHISADGKVILLSIAQNDCYGLKDLYASFRQPDGTYTRPQNLGPHVNTAGDEVTPFLAADGKTLYFSSDGRPGYGKNDIYVCKRLDASWTKWSPPLNLGPTINTSNWDAYYTIPASGDLAYFTSYDDSYGSGDIFSISITDEQAPEAVVMISGQVLDATTNAPIQATIQVTAGDTLQIDASTNPNNGRYQVVVPTGIDGMVAAIAPGYYAQAYPINSANLTHYREDTIDLAMYPIKPGEVIPLNEINFELNSATLTADSYRALDHVAGFLLAQPTVRIEIGGHTNNRCSASYCKQLSADRAKAVADYLIQVGIAKRQVTHVGYGKVNPIDSNDTEEGRQRNQRVEFTILTID